MRMALSPPARMSRKSSRTRSGTGKARPRASGANGPWAYYYVALLCVVIAAGLVKVVELACRWFAEHVQPRPLTREEKIALWRDDSQWVSRHPGPPLADEMMTREGIYGDSERGF